MPPTDLPAVRTDRRRKLREVVDTAVKEFEASPQAKLMDASFEQAYRLMTSTAAREALAARTRARRTTATSTVGTGSANRCSWYGG